MHYLFNIFQYLNNVHMDISVKKLVLRASDDGAETHANKCHNKANFLSFSILPHNRNLNHSCFVKFGGFVCLKKTELLRRDVLKMLY